LGLDKGEVLYFMNQIFKSAYPLETIQTSVEEIYGRPPKPRSPRKKRIATIRLDYSDPDAFVEERLNNALLFTMKGINK
jgi:hypothetical protein